MEDQDAKDGGFDHGASAGTREKIGPEDEKREALDGEPSAAQKVRDDFAKAEDTQAGEKRENREEP